MKIIMRLFPQKTLLCRLLQSRTVLLHTTKAEILSSDENIKASSRILISQCSQGTYCTGSLRKTLKLKIVRKETNFMKRFASDEGVLKILDVVQICARGKTKNVNVFIETLCIPLLCSSIQNQTLNGVFNENYDYLKDLALSGDYNNTTGKSIDLLVGKEFYFNFETGKVC